MNDVLDAVSARIKAPYFGYSVLAFVALNWRGIFLLTTEVGTPRERLVAFDGETSFWSLVVLPLLVGAIVAATAPWIRFAFGFISVKPFALLDDIQLQAEHRKTIRKTELEQSRSQFFAVKETELIDRAKRDELVLEIEDDNVKERLQAELEALRQERDRVSTIADAQPTLTLPEAEILRAASALSSGTISIHEYISGRSIQAGSATYGEESQQQFVKYERALKALVEKQLVQQRGHTGKLFELTFEGWQLAGTLGPHREDGAGSQS